jgi:D-alanine-D-alanine ligase-like ATP-grasp enzyme
VSITLLCDPWRLHPLSWIHRAEAHAVAEELRRAGHEVKVTPYRSDSISNLPAGPLLLRLSDPVMLNAVQALTSVGLSFIGPGAEVMARCYDKYEAYRIATANGVDCPTTALAIDSNGVSFPSMLKPRRGSDSLGVRLLRDGRIPMRFRSDAYLTQEHVRGSELTVAVLDAQVGMPLHIQLPEGVPYSFVRKYLLRPPLTPVADTVLGERVRDAALKIAAVFGVNWAARIDLIHETDADRLRFLECDVAPLVGAGSAFAASLRSAGIDRDEQLRMLIGEIADVGERRR